MQLRPEKLSRRVDLGKRCTYSGKSKNEKRDLKTSGDALRKVRCSECRIEREERFREAGPAFSVPDVRPPESLI